MAEIKSKKEKTDRREIVIPGEVIATGDFLPGDWTSRNGEDIIATRLGTVDKADKLVKIIPISGAYSPRRGNVVLGKIEDITMRGWIVDIDAPYSAFLTLKECPMYIAENEMEEVHAIGDLIIAKITKMGRDSIDLTINGRGLGKINKGIIIKINPNRVPRLIGKEGSMIKQIKDASQCDVSVGQNGLVWVTGNDLENEVFARKAIEFVVENTTVEGLTEKVEEWLKKNKTSITKTKQEKGDEK